MNQNKSSIDFPLAEAFEKTINTAQGELLAIELHRKMTDYFWESQRPEQ